MSSQIESRAIMPACSKWGLYDYEAASRYHDSSIGLNDGSLPRSTQSVAEDICSSQRVNAQGSESKV
jgi:hypothetical protein